MDQEIFTKAALIQTKNSKFFKFTSKMHAEHTEVLHVITVCIVYKSNTDTKLILIKDIAKNRLYRKRLHS
jgi:hypothetical protein